MPEHKRKPPPGSPGVEMDARLRDSMFRMSRRDPMFIGYHLGRLRDARGQTVEDQAAALGLSVSALAFVSMCKPPRSNRYHDDLAQVAGRVGLRVHALEAILRDAGALEPAADANAPSDFDRKEPTP